MATKAEFLNGIDTALILKINKTRLLAGFTDVADELYNEPIIDTQLTTNVVSVVQTGITYTAVFKKTGNTVFIEFKVRNNNEFAISNVRLFNMENLVFRPIYDVLFYTDEIGVGINPSDGDVYLTTTLLARRSFNLTGSYQTNI